MDPLSDVLSLLKPVSHVSAGFDAGGDWAVRFGDQQCRIKCYAVVSGGCWLTVDGVGEPVRLSAGESFVLPAGRPFSLCSDPAQPAIAAETIFPPARAGGVVRVNGGGGVFLVGSRFAIGEGPVAGLLASLPPIIHIREEGDRAALRWLVEHMMRELREARPGRMLIAGHLAHMMLVQALRIHLEASAGQGVGWFFALADKRLAAALTALHGDPARRWSLRELAAAAGMSRSVFALRFREAVGETPMDYLTRWRMLLAVERLETTREPIAAIAYGLGYASEGAFSTAFKRVMGCPPRDFARRRR